MTTHPSPTDLVHQLFARFSASDIDGVMRLLSPDATWKVPGKPEQSRAAGVYDTPRIEGLFRRMLERLRGGLAMTVVGTIAEGDRVAAEVVSSGDLENGRAYRQEYLFWIETRDGKITSVREYLDTHHAWDVWMRP
jgi:ketosteroid isomerase-like protein